MRERIFVDKYPAKLPNAAATPKIVPAKAGAMSRQLE